MAQVRDSLPPGRGEPQGDRLFPGSGEPQGDRVPPGRGEPQGDSVPPGWSSEGDCDALGSETLALGSRQGSHLCVPEVTPCVVCCC